MTTKTREQILAELTALPTGAATSANQSAANALLTSLAAEDYATQATLAALLAKVIAAPATEAKQDALIAKDFATQATLAAILAKLIAAPATEATLAALLANTSTTLYGATTATRPAANTVPAGTVFVAVTSPLGITMSNGSAWVVI